jgi:hypothetical protein
VYLQIAQLCIKAGADTPLISRWIEEGWRRGRCEAATVHGIGAISEPESAAYFVPK